MPSAGELQLSFKIQLQSEAVSDTSESHSSDTLTMLTSLCFSSRRPLNSGFDCGSYASA